MRVDQVRYAYLWTLFRPHEEPATGYGFLGELAGWLDNQNLPGVAPSTWIVDVFLEKGDNGHLEYSHDVGGGHQWKIILAPAARHEIENLSS